MSHEAKYGNWYPGLAFTGENTSGLPGKLVKQLYTFVPGLLPRGKETSTGPEQRDLDLEAVALELTVGDQTGHVLVIPKQEEGYTTYEFFTMTSDENGVLRPGSKAIHEEKPGNGPEQLHFSTGKTYPIPELVLGFVACKAKEDKLPVATIGQIAGLFTVSEQQVPFT